MFLLFLGLDWVCVWYGIRAIWIYFPSFLFYLFLALNSLLDRWYILFFLFDFLFFNFIFYLFFVRSPFHLLVPMPFFLLIWRSKYIRASVTVQKLQFKTLILSFIWKTRRHLYLCNTLILLCIYKHECTLVVIFVTLLIPCGKIPYKGKICHQTYMFCCVFVKFKKVKIFARACQPGFHKPWGLITSPPTDRGI